ncbi:ShlB/FhaC/HecB family hemolysin secretion/activation protein [Sphingomonas baiyangensis]|uniref:ShlB/FhaC/HecB family hemolysin secretion/activation protein n=1 Tax=Sphingomonas baiyangensis TaxID=2572576 RepID=A0A4U1L0B6_9SPHN|nr:ShlB/FhaC/HecB family hemolysin secretion/activation protein [Sphingomonas baiyangensis]TKD50052.1 ShlB/FhaC/HecB family hemolysin secretion/activation protein [Sphingomonas baiyangensis]
MRVPRFTLAFLAASAALAPQAASAQDRPPPALDRVDPGQPDRQERAEEPIERAAPPRPAAPVEVPVARVNAAPADTRILVGAIMFSGLEVLQPADFADIVAAHVGRELDRTALSDLAGRVAARARARGYVFASAVIDPQRVETGVLTVRVDEGRIDRIDVQGDASQAVEAALAPLADGRPATLAEVERRLLLAGDLPGIRVRASRFVRDGNQGVLQVRVDADRLSGRVVFENDGSRPIGPEQLRLDVDMAALAVAGDALAVTYVTTPFDFGELHYGRARYAVRVDSSGTELGLVGTISATDPGAYLRERDLEGRSWFAGVTLLQPLWRRRDASLWFESELGLRDLRQYRGGALARHDRILAMRVGLYGHVELVGGRLRANASLSRGLAGLNATRLGDPLASRDDAPADFTTLTLWADYIRDLGSDFSIRVAGRSQLSSEPLLLAEEVGLGGGAFLRGYNYNERSGDQGAMAMGELRWNWQQPLGGLVRRSQLYAFADGGRVTNLEGGRGSGSLASSGGGVRTFIGNGLGADFEIAVPLSGPRYDTGDADPRFNVRIAKTF